MQKSFPIPALASASKGSQGNRPSRIHPKNSLPTGDDLLTQLQSPKFRNVFLRDFPKILLGRWM